jgi:serine/threonine protein phosphatase 1
MAAPICYLPANSQGKDYIVGDLHGCFSLLERLLNAAHFDESKDRLFSVGDLIDRGPESLRCIQLLDEAWFYAVRGNHELMMAEFFDTYLLQGSIADLSSADENGFLEYGGDWVKRYFLADEQCMTAEFDRCLNMTLHLPLIYVVGEGKQRFHIIHAELAKSNQDYSNDMTVWQDSDIDAWYTAQSIPEEIESNLCWGRALMLSHLVDFESTAIHPGLSPTFCGHTPRPKLRRALSHVCIDTGAFVSLKPAFFRVSGEEFGLTLFDVSASSWVFASYLRDEVVWGTLF